MCFTHVLDTHILKRIKLTPWFHLPKIKNLTVPNSERYSSMSDSGFGLKNLLVSQSDAVVTEDVRVVHQML